MWYKHQSQKTDDTFITSDGSSPYNSTRYWADKRHYREDYNPHTRNDVKYKKGVIRVLRHAVSPAGDPNPQARVGVQDGTPTQRRQVQSLDLLL